MPRPAIDSKKQHTAAHALFVLFRIPSIPHLYGTSAPPVPGPTLKSAPLISTKALKVPNSRFVRLIILPRINGSNNLSSNILPSPDQLMVISVLSPYEARIVSTLASSVSPVTCETQLLPGSQETILSSNTYFFPFCE